MKQIYEPFWIFHFFLDRLFLTLACYLPGSFLRNSKLHKELIVVAIFRWYSQISFSVQLIDTDAAIPTMFLRVLSQIRGYDSCSC